jgi:hypothetical protein
MVCQVCLCLDLRFGFSHIDGSGLDTIRGPQPRVIRRQAKAIARDGEPQ